MEQRQNPKPLAASKNTNIENEQDTPKSQLIREWIGAMNENETERDEYVELYTKERTVNGKQ